MGNLILVGGALALMVLYFIKPRWFESTFAYVIGTILEMMCAIIVIVILMHTITYVYETRVEVVNMHQHLHDTGLTDNCPGILAKPTLQEKTAEFMKKHGMYKVVWWW